MTIDQVQRLDRILRQRAQLLDLTKSIIDREATAAGVVCETSSTAHVLRAVLLDQTIAIRIVIDERGNAVVRLDVFEVHGGWGKHGRIFRHADMLQVKATDAGAALCDSKGSPVNTETHTGLLAAIATAVFDQ